MVEEMIEFIATESGCGNSGAVRCGWCLCCTAFWVTFICILCSFAGVEPTEYALVKHDLSQTLTGETLEGGLQWVGIAYSTVRYPKTIQSIEFSDNEATRKAGRLKTRTKEGLEIQISCAIQYRMIKDDLIKVYRMFETDYETKYIRFARSTILFSVSQWNSFDFWTKRTEVGDMILKQLRIEFKKAGAYVVHFNMMKINLPGAFNNAIIATQVMVQDYIKFQETLKVEKIKRVTENIRATANKNIAVTKAIAQKNATEILENAKGELAAQTITGINKQLQLIQQNLFTGGSAEAKANIMEFFTLLRIDELSDDTNNKLLYQVSGSTTLN